MVLTYETEFDFPVCLLRTNVSQKALNTNLLYLKQPEPTLPSYVNATKIDKL